MTKFCIASSSRDLAVADISPRDRDFSYARSPSTLAEDDARSLEPDEAEALAPEILDSTCQALPPLGSPNAY